MATRPRVLPPFWVAKTSGPAWASAGQDPQGVVPRSRGPWRCCTPCLGYDDEPQRQQEPTMADVYEQRSYAQVPIGFGQKPGIVVVDYQVGFTDP